VEDFPGRNVGRSRQLVATPVGVVCAVRASAFQSFQAGAFLLEQAPHVGLADEDGESQDARRGFDDIYHERRFVETADGVRHELGQPRHDFQDEQAENDAQAVELKYSNDSCQKSEHIYDGYVLMGKDGRPTGISRGSGDFPTRSQPVEVECLS
jgi:hypothetical protein